jgi:hypothetical protein
MVNVLNPLGNSVDHDFAKNPYRIDTHDDAYDLFLPGAEIPS